MADIALAHSNTYLNRLLARPKWLNALVRSAEVRRRRARRDRYLAIVGRLPHRYPWFTAMVTVMGRR